jgi:NAD(P)-dependent dehydrogenase (short-subunit alcohol dehydrogenase family)
MTAQQEKGAVIVTGASRGIGAAIAQKVAEDGYGVLVNYATDADGAQSVVSTIRGRGGRALAVRADVATPGDIADIFERAKQELRSNRRRLLSMNGWERRAFIKGALAMIAFTPR